MEFDNVNQECKLCKNNKWQKYTLSSCQCTQCLKNYLIFEEKTNEIAFEVLFLKDNFDANNQITFDYINKIVQFDGCKLQDGSEVAFAFAELEDNLALDNLLKIRDVHTLIG